MENKIIRADASSTKSFILDFLVSHKTARISDMFKAVRLEYPDMTYSVLGGALGQLRRSGRIVSVERGVYSIVDLCQNADADPFVSCTVSAKSRIDCALQNALHDALKDVTDCRTTIKDMKNMDVYLAKAAILVETRDFLTAQLEKLNHIDSEEVSA